MGSIFLPKCISHPTLQPFGLLLDKIIISLQHYIRCNKVDVIRQCSHIHNIGQYHYALKSNKIILGFNLDLDLGPCKGHGINVS